MFFDTIVNNNFHFQTDYTGLEKVSRYESEKNSLTGTINKKDEDQSNNRTSIIHENKGDSEDRY
jgi:hypothetical protein